MRRWSCHHAELASPGANPTLAPAAQVGPQRGAVPIFRMCATVLCTGGRHVRNTYSVTEREKQGFVLQIVRESSLHGLVLIRSARVVGLFPPLGTSAAAAETVAMDVSLQTISGLLRAAFAELPYDLATAAADRSRWLHSRRSQLAAGVQSAPAWRELTHGIPTTTAGYSDHAVHYRRFLSAVSVALGG